MQLALERQVDDREGDVEDQEIEDQPEGLIEGELVEIARLDFATGRGTRCR
jgi:hypothetical protein